MDNGLAKLLNDAKQEIEALKVANVSSSVQTATTLKSISTDFSLRKTRVAGGTVSNQYAKLTIAPSNDQPILAQCTQDVTDLAGREMRTARIIGSGNSIIFYIWVSGNPSDYSIIDSGGSVNLSYTIDVTATTDFTISLTYEENS